MADTHKITVTFEHLKSGRCRANIHAETPSGGAWFYDTADSPVEAIQLALNAIEKQPRNYGKKAGRNTTAYLVASDLKRSWKQIGPAESTT